MQFMQNCGHVSAAKDEPGTLPLPMCCLHYLVLMWWMASCLLSVSSKRAWICRSQDACQNSTLVAASQRSWPAEHDQPAAHCICRACTLAALSWPHTWIISTLICPELHRRPWLLYSCAAQCICRACTLAALSWARTCSISALIYLELHRRPCAGTRAQQRCRRSAQCEGMGSCGTHQADDML